MMTIDGSAILALLDYVRKLERVRNLVAELRSVWIDHTLASQMEDALQACKERGDPLMNPPKAEYLRSVRDTLQAEVKKLEADLAHVQDCSQYEITQIKQGCERRYTQLAELDAAIVAYEAVLYREHSAVKD